MPVIVLEPGPPVGGPQKCLHGTGQVYKEVTHQKEHGQNGGHHVKGSNQDAQLSDERCQEEGPRRFTVCFPMAKHPEEGDDVILGNGLQ